MSDLEQVMEKIKPMVLEWCGDPAHRWWRTHVESVVEYSQMLAERLGGNKEILEVSAWLHDIKKIRDGEKEDHHVKGAKEAGEILTGLGYPMDKVQQVIYCILTHSSDETRPPGTMDAKILASADSLSHFDNFMAFAHWVYSLDGLSIADGRDMLVKKYAKNWKKLMPEAREIAQPKYDAIKSVLGEGS